MARPLDYYRALYPPALPTFSVKTVAAQLAELVEEVDDGLEDLLLETGDALETEDGVTLISE